jgi:hypothetical protein
MSVGIRSKRSQTPASTAAAPAAELPSRTRVSVPEAPEQGAQEREAPEALRRDRWTHIPEPDEGRAGLLEHEFTHGRSQS